MAIPISLRLAVRQWLARPLRPILCSLAIAAAVALIVCVGVAMDSLRQTMVKAVGQALGDAEAHVRPAQRGTDARVPVAIAEQLRAMPEVKAVNARLFAKGAVGEAPNHRWFDVVGVDPVLESELRPKTYTAGGALTGAMDEVVIDGMIAKEMNLTVGSTIPLWVKEDGTKRPLRVVGITERPAIEIIAKPTLFLPVAALEKDMGLTGEYSELDVKLKEGTGIEDFDAYARELGEKLGKSVEVMPGTSSKARLADVEQTLRVLLLLLSTMSAFCASLIIGTTLSVGVQERVRQFGQLRCIGASRMQLAWFLLGDAAVMMMIGVGMGLLFGLGLSMALIAWFPNVFQVYHVSAASIGVALFSGGLATLLGSMIPIWQVTRVPPMAAVTASGRGASRSRVWLAAWIGLACLVVQVLLWVAPSSRDVRVFGYVFLGIPLIMAGWCLFAPAFVLVAERIAARPLAMVFDLNTTLLRGAWSRTPWRAGAMIAALMIGVTLFTTVRARGESLKNSWVTPKIPDLVVKLNPLLELNPFQSKRGFNAQRIERLKREHPEVEDMVPFEYFTVTMKSPPDTAVGRMMKEEQTTFIAVDPGKFSEMVELDFDMGDRKTAIEQMASGQHVLVSREFYNVRKLGVGDKLTLRSAEGKDVEFTIAGVVTSTGVEAVKSYFDLRAGFGEKAVTSLLGTLEDGKKHFKLGDPTLMLMNVHDSVSPPEVLALRKKLDTEGMASASSVELKETLTGVINRIMNGLSVIGLGALCVASLGVANMVIASVHARRYEFGVLRAIGAGRWQLVRLVLAEVTLIGLIAGTLGMGAGMWYAFMATQVDWVVVGFETFFINPDPVETIRVLVLLLMAAVGLTTLLGWLASIVPAVRGASAAQRTLLAAGRG